MVVMCLVPKNKFLLIELRVVIVIREANILKTKLTSTLLTVKRQKFKFSNEKSNFCRRNW